MSIRHCCADIFFDQKQRSATTPDTSTTCPSSKRRGCVERSFDRKEIYYRNKHYKPVEVERIKKRKKVLPVLVISMTRKALCGPHVVTQTGVEGSS